MVERRCLGLPGQPCMEWSTKARCPRHTRAFSQWHGTSRQRGYGAEYERNRAIILSRSRACWKCGGYATTAGHVIARVHGGGCGLGNLRPECGPCNHRDGGALSRGGRGA